MTPTSKQEASRYELILLDTNSSWVTYSKTVADYWLDMMSNMKFEKYYVAELFKGLEEIPYE